MTTTSVQSVASPYIGGEIWVPEPEGPLSAPYKRNRSARWDVSIPVDEVTGLNLFGKPFAYKVFGPKPEGFGFLPTEALPESYGLFLHGGPGSRLPQEAPRSFGLTQCVFAPEQRRVTAVPLDQNTIWELVEDLEALRAHYNVPRWTIYGSSWGATLGLAYLLRYPQHVQGLVGTCVPVPGTGEWILSEACGMQSALHTRHYRKLAKAAGAVWKHGLRGLYSLFLQGFRIYENLGEDAFLAPPYADIVKAWVEYSVTLDDARERDIGEELAKVGTDLVYQLQRGLLQLHYFVNGLFWATEDDILRQLKAVQEVYRVPVSLIFGEHDVITRRGNAWTFIRASGAETFVIREASHNYTPLFKHVIVEELRRLSQG